MILSLKRFNQNVCKHHSKMESLQSAVRQMKPGSYMASIDLKDAYCCSNTQITRKISQICTARKVVSVYIFPSCFRFLAFHELSTGSVHCAPDCYCQSMLFLNAFFGELTLIRE